MPEKPRILLPLAFSAFMAVGMILGGKMQDNGPVIAFLRSEERNSAGGAGSLEEVIRYMESRYVDSINRDTLYQAALTALVSRLDPYSAYLSAEDASKLSESREGSFTGVGLEYMVSDDTVWVLRALPASPAHEAGIQTGDRLVQIGNTPLTDIRMDRQLIGRLMHGEPGSKVFLRIVRDQKQIDVTLRRANVSLPSVMPGVMLDDTCGYISIQRFGSNTYREFMEEIEVLSRDRGMKHLLVDLRGNPGGYLEEATNILSQFFQEKDQMLVYTLDKRKDRKEYRSTGKIFFPINRILVLVDESSASASEVVAGAIQDWDRGLVVGRPTFGKGLVQEQFPLRDGSALLLTTARYYTPSGRSIQKENRSSIKASPGDSGLSENKPFFTSKGRPVSAGGGIQPDITFPRDSLLPGTDMEELKRLAIGFLFLEIKGYKDRSEISLPSAELWQRFERHALSRRPDLREPIARMAVKQTLQVQLFGDLARALGGETLQQETLAKVDNQIRQAHILLKDRTNFQKLGR